MTITIEKEIDYHFDFDEEQVINDVINAAIDYIKCPFEATVSVTITDNDGIHAINKEFRDIDRPTDVLSFPMVEYEIAGDFEFLCGDDFLDVFDPESGELVLGDIVLSVDKIKEQAREYGHTEKRELAFLTAHSMFHLFGFDHMEEDEAKIMESHQNNVLEQLGITR